MTAALALGAAVLAALRADPTLAADLGGRIWDVAPRDPAFPHLVVDDATCRDRSGVDAELEEARLTLRVSSRDGGRAEAARLVERAETVLAAAVLAPAGRRVVLWRRDTTDVRTTRDRRTHEAVVRFVALTEPT